MEIPASPILVESIVYMNSFYNNLYFPRYPASVPENANPGTSVYTVRANDADETPPNNKIKYTLQKGR